MKVISSTMNWTEFKQFFIDSKNIGILGFGREGQSTYKAIRKILPDIPVTVCDQKEWLPSDLALIEGHENTIVAFGENYLDGLKQADLIIKSPGIPLHVLKNANSKAQVVSQTEIFLRLFRNQVVGITGTKGKSTTTSLLFHILKTAERKVVLAGNIGIPPLDLIGEVEPGSVVVFEMSSHQLEHCRLSPHISILLNIFEEHLDHYASYRHYQLAKMNISKWQGASDYFIFNGANQVIEELVREQSPAASCWMIGRTSGLGPKVHCDNNDLLIHSENSVSRIEGLFEGTSLPGAHNRLNISAAATAAYLLKVPYETILKAVRSFKGLPHRLEFLGKHRNILFYNDSISTIPESTMAALNTLQATTTLILGGYDRGVSYKNLIEYLAGSQVKCLVFLGEAGRRIYLESMLQGGFPGKECLFPETFDQGFELAVSSTPPSGICLLSPAAASYDAFLNFEHRGDAFRNLVNKFSN